MERLTIEYCGEYVPKELCSIDKLGGADDCDLCCEYCKATDEGNEDCRECAINQCFNKLGEYENLEEQKKLLTLECAIGDTVYYPDNERYFIVIPVKINAIIIGELNTVQYEGCSFDAHGDPETDFAFDSGDFGKSVFLTMEDAEKAIMAEQEGDRAVG